MRGGLFKTCLFIVGINVASFASAMGLGAAQVKSSLGQSLNVVIPVLSSDSVEKLTDKCFSLAPPSSTDDSLPALKKARLVFNNTASVPYLVLTTQAGIEDPVLVFVIETNCSGMVRREYTLLLDVVNNAVNTPQAPMDTDLPASVKIRAPAVKARVVSSKPKRRSTGHAVTVKPTTVPLHAQLTVLSTPNLVLHMSEELNALPSQSHMAGARMSTPMTTQGRLSIDTGAAAERDRLQDDIVAIQQQLAQTRLELQLLRAQMAKGQGNVSELPLSVDKQHVSGWKSGWLWSGLALSVLAFGYLLDRRRKLSRSPFPSVADEVFVASNKYAPVVNEMASAPVHDDMDASTTALEDVGFVENKLPGQELLARPSIRNQKIHTEALSVSKLMQVTEEAEVFLGLGYADRDIAALTEDIAANPRNHPAVWFMLLGIYRKQNDRISFDQTIADFRQRFNLNPPNWQSIVHQEQEGEGLLAIPHIQGRLVSLWPQHQAHSYLCELLYDDRQGSRQGFSLDVYRDIIWLREILDILSKPETTIAEQVAADDTWDWDL